MHKLWCGDIRGSHGSDELHELWGGGLLDIDQSVSIVDVHRLCGGHLRCEHRIDVMRSMQHRHLLNDEC